eukprot:TRINITY_DN8248_c0_g3_i4.p1 TRINITY_DN8248_c0_g3~~TRINITY_DN8248_c0_g3_i4.p1  ORF type:complete len:272 (+),score=-0.21 TRINITY_DN8248_c0_g3_i4:314-1129(+)
MITIEGVQNPYKAGYYPNLLVKIRNNDNDLLVRSKPLPVTFDLKNTGANIQTEITYSKDFNVLKYSFALAPIEFTEDYSDDSHLEVTPLTPDQVCKPAETEYSNLKHVQGLTYKLSGPPTDLLIFTLDCEKPDLTQGDFKFVITDKGTNDRVTAYENTTIDEGTRLSADAFTLDCGIKSPIIRECGQIAHFLLPEQPQLLLNLSFKPSADDNDPQCADCRRLLVSRAATRNLLCRHQRLCHHLHLWQKHNCNYFQYFRNKSIVHYHWTRIY